MKYLIIILVIIGCSTEPIPDLDSVYFHGTWSSTNKELIFIDGYSIDKSYQGFEVAIYEAWEFRTIGNQIAIDHILYDVTIINQDQFILESELYERKK